MLTSGQPLLILRPPAHRQGWPLNRSLTVYSVHKKVYDVFYEIVAYEREQVPSWGIGRNKARERSKGEGEGRGEGESLPAFVLTPVFPRLTLLADFFSPNPDYESCSQAMK